jgi:hypothetical protein
MRYLIHAIASYEVLRICCHPKSTHTPIISGSVTISVIPPTPVMPTLGKINMHSVPISLSCSLATKAASHREAGID